MRRFLITAGLLAALILPMLTVGTPHLQRSGPAHEVNVSFERLQDVLAESGCSSSAHSPYRSGGIVYGSGGFACAPGDYGSRVLQACIIVNGTWWDCDTDAYNATSSGQTTAECHFVSGQGTYWSQSWYYFRGEDGSEYSGYGNGTYQYCNYGID